jgi:hypothetical protein
MVVAWPSRIKANGDLRTQFTHCIDVGPTVLELVDIPEPTVVDGIQQEPMDGTSFAYTLDEDSAAERHTVQYFEVCGSRAIYKDGWWACARLDKLPWDLTLETIHRFAPGVYDPDQDAWELYYLPDDFSQAKNRAADNPGKLEELQELFWQEAERNRALPLLGGISAFLGDMPPLPTSTRLGVLVAFADFIGGFSLWVDEKRLLNHTYQFLGVDTYKQTSTEPIPTSPSWARAGR